VRVDELTDPRSNCCPLYVLCVEKWDCDSLRSEKWRSHTVKQNTVIRSNQRYRFTISNLFTLHPQHNIFDKEKPMSQSASLRLRKIGNLCLIDTFSLINQKNWYVLSIKDFNWLHCFPLQIYQFTSEGLFSLFEQQGILWGFFLFVIRADGGLIRVTVYTVVCLLVDFDKTHQSTIAGCLNCETTHAPLPFFEFCESTDQNGTVVGGGGSYCLRLGCRLDKSLSLSKLDESTHLCLRDSSCWRWWEIHHADEVDTRRKGDFEISIFYRRMFLSLPLSLFYVVNLIWNKLEKANPHRYFNQMVMFCSTVLFYQMH